jgi:elongation factor Ts
MITIEQIKELRTKTGAGMMDCKEALKASNGDYEQAVVYLRKKGLKDITKRSHKTASEGTIGRYFHPGDKLCAIVEVNCETDFVAKGDAFREFANEVAMHIVASNPQYVSRDCVPAEVIDREKSVFEESLGGKPQQVIDKIVDGKLAKFYKEVCLLEQPFVRDNNITVSDLLGDLASKVGENIVVKRFVRITVGE